MPRQDTLDRFVAMVESNAHDRACEEFYAEHSTMQENQAAPRLGRDRHVANERAVMARAKTMSSRCVRPVLVNGDHVVIRWIFRFEWLDGSVTQMEELAWQRWQDERIVEETFFYDPAQRVPKRPEQAV
ncbi:MAG TPA: nuclear transport factor 2 family protein [Burkholderiaceae bacterium]